MIAKKLKTKLLTADDMPAEHAWDLELPVNTRDGKGAVIFSFSFEDELDKFTEMLEMIMRHNDCWAGLEIEKTRDR